MLAYLHTLVYTLLELSITVKTFSCFSPRLCTNVRHDIVDAVIWLLQAIKRRSKFVATEKREFIKLMDNMPASQAELARLSGVNERTIIRMKNGETILRGTANKVLRGLSQIYGEQFTLDNVAGINISDR